MGTANRPSSSTTTTAGSRALLTRWGATDRTAIPAAPTKIRASARRKAAAVHSSARSPFRVQAARCPLPLQAGRQRGGQPPTILCKGNKLHSHWDASR